MLKCGNCGYVLEENDECMGFCPRCNKDTLIVIEIICPICRRELGEATHCDMNVIGWCCEDCNIKIYKEL